MNKNDIKNRISKLPSGGITIKNIKNKKTGKSYEYHVYQWREDGKQKSRYLKDEEIADYSKLIEERKELEKALLREELGYARGSVQSLLGEEAYVTDVQTGDDLKGFIESVKGLKKRELYQKLSNYVFGEEYNKVFILYGLRRTGKTTMIRQALAKMSKAQLKKAAFIQARSTNNLSELNKDLKLLMKNGYKYVFIDEVTLLEDFIEGAAFLSDIYAASGMKLVLSGTDSLGFWISKSNELYDRCHLLHTTFISYREFENVLGIKGIDEYIKHGGTMSMSGNHYNTFASKKDVDEYVDSAIAQNIQHSLRCYQDAGHFRHLATLYENDELTNAINRVVEDINHRFTLEVLTRDFKSNDLALSARNLRKESDVLDQINKDAVTKRLKEMLEIKNRDETLVNVDETHVKEIREYLDVLDLTRDIAIVDIDHYGDPEKKVAFTQAGLRYAQAQALVEALMNDEIFKMLSFDEKKNVTERIMTEIEGRMLEDIVLLETAVASDKEVFKLHFANGEYDMVVFDKNNGGCKIFEIKYSKIIDKNQYRHLVDKKKIEKTEFRFGKIEEKIVLYRGDSKIVDDVRYINVEEYLKSL